MKNTNSKRTIRDVVISVCIMGFTALILQLVYKNIEIMIGSILLYELFLFCSLPLLHHFRLEKDKQMNECLDLRYKLLDRINSAYLWQEFSEFGLFLNKALCFEEIRVTYMLNCVSINNVNLRELKKIFDEEDFKQFIIDNREINPNVKEKLINSWIMSKDPDPFGIAHKEYMNKDNKNDKGKLKLYAPFIISSLVFLLGSIFMTIFYGINGIGRIAASCAVITPIIVGLTFIGKKDTKLSVKHKLEKFNYYIYYFFDEKDKIPEREKKNIDNIIARYKLGIQ